MYLYSYGNLGIQASTRDYLSQKFRNLRRNSQPVPAHREIKPKIVTAQHAVPVATGRPSSADDDLVAYERNCQSLSEELSKANPNSSRVYQLLKLNHTTRRGKIEHCDLHAFQLKQEYPFFGSNKWVSTMHVIMVWFNTCIITAL